MKSIFFTLLLLIATSAYSQTTARLLRFDEPTRNLDSIKELGPMVQLQFRYTNISNKPVTILDIHSQCGCLTAKYDRKPLAPGATRTLNVTFDPKGRMGEFRLGLTTTSTNGDYKKYNTLTLLGYVINHIPEYQINYPYILSSQFRAATQKVGMRLFTKDKMEPRTRSITLYNTTSKTLYPQYRSSSANLTISGPESIAPHTKAEIAYTFDPKDFAEGYFTIPTRVETANVVTIIDVSGKIE